MPTKAITQYLASIGAKGGASGKGKAKVRGSSDHYKALAAKSAAVRLTCKCATLNAAGLLVHDRPDCSKFFKEGK